MSRKSKSYRAWLHAVGGGTLEDAFFAGWAAQKGLAHARSVQSLRAENEVLKIKNSSLCSALAESADVMETAGIDILAQRYKAALRGEGEK